MITGKLSIKASTGRELVAGTDLSLAWLWAEEEHGAKWDTLSYGEKCTSVAEALAELRRAYREQQNDDDSEAGLM